MTPYDIALLSQELADHMLILASADLSPIDNAALIEQHRRAAFALSQQIAGYLLVADAFAPVQNESAA